MGSLALKQVRRLDGSLVLIVSGIVDDATVECFEKGLDRATGAGSRQVIVDLTTCQLASAGLAALVRLWRRAGGRSGETCLVAPDVALFRMLQIVGLTSQFPTYLTMDAALPSPPAARSPVAWGRGMVAMRAPRHAGPRGDGEVWPRRTSLDEPGRRGTPLPRRPLRRASRPAWIEGSAGDE